jgi:hypothetical protein
MSIKNYMTVNLINVISVGNWLLFSFGIVSIKKYYLLLLAPIPSIFYIITAKFTNPENY